jgi:hypothetical protein
MLHLSFLKLTNLDQQTLIKLFYWVGKAQIYGISLKNVLKENIRRQVLRFRGGKGVTVADI